MQFMVLCPTSVEPPLSFAGFHTQMTGLRKKQHIDRPTAAGSEEKNAAHTHKVLVGIC